MPVRTLIKLRSSQQGTRLGLRSPGSGSDFSPDALLGDVPQDVDVQGAQVGSSHGVQLIAAQLVPSVAQVPGDDGLRLDRQQDNIR